MQLWTDYEGTTIDGAFLLRKLLLPEGRSAFFSTANGQGEPVVLRLIECHFDEQEILSRWRSVSALAHANLLRLGRFGTVELDGGPVVYAVFEKTDICLADVLREGRLATKEAAQLAVSLLVALETLHAHGFVHEHVEPRNIFAVGETVKLRSDCIREAPEGAEGAEAKRRDVHDLAAVLLEALTQRQTLDGLGPDVLPAQLDAVARNGMSGGWGLKEIRAALKGEIATPLPQSIEASPGTPRSAASRAEAPAENDKPSSKSSGNAPWDANVVRSRIRQEVGKHRLDEGSLLRSKWVGVAAMIAMVVMLAGALALREWRRAGKQEAQAASKLSITEIPAVQAAPARRAGSAYAPAPDPRPLARDATGARAQWRVIAFTFHREADARKKTEAIAATRPDLRPDVFAPNGHAPYLVTVGGIMNSDQAHSLARKAHTIGLPRDTYAQNYIGGQ